MWAMEKGIICRSGARRYNKRNIPWRRNKIKKETMDNKEIKAINTPGGGPLTPAFTDQIPL